MYFLKYDKNVVNWIIVCIKVIRYYIYIYVWPVCNTQHVQLCADLIVM